MDNVIYQLAAFIIVWAVLFGYLFAVSRRQRQLRRDLDSLKDELGNVRKQPVP